jgi:hypothetical protein
VGERLESLIQGQANDGYDFGSDLAERARRIEARQMRPDFDECAFDGYVMDLKIRPGGDLEIRIGVPKSHKWDALQLSDAAGIMVSFAAHRRWKGGKHDQLAGVPGDQQPGDPDDGEGPATDNEAFVHDPRRTDLIRYLQSPESRE